MEPRKGGRPSKYPWDLWMNGEEYTIYNGLDFHVSRKSMRTMMHQKCIDEPYKVETTFVEDHLKRQGIIFRFVNEADALELQRRKAEAYLQGRTPVGPPTLPEHSEPVGLQRTDISDEALAKLNKPVEP
jgi:hypothetical protein